MSYPFKIIFVAVGLILCRTAVFAQNITEKNWLFGNSQYYLVFDKSGRDVVEEDDKNPSMGIGGSAVISDQFTGDLMFYTDGQLIYDANHNLLQAVLSGDTLSAITDKNQAAVTCPVPGTTDQFYIFTNSDTAIHYSIVDASIQGNGSATFPLGDLTGTVNNDFGLANPAEGMIIIEQGDGRNYWLITQDVSTYNLQFTYISDAGPPFTTTDTLIFSGSLPAFEINQFAFHEETNQLALAPKDINRNVLVLSFDPANDSISVVRSVRRSGVLDEIYDVEWSTDGTKLYFSTLGDSTDAGGVYQLNFADTVDTDPYLVNDLLPYTFYRSYGLKRGIDERIYHLYQENEGDPFRVGRFIQIDSIPELVLYNNLVSEEDFIATQFPACAPPQLESFIEVRFEYLDSCQGNTTQFFAYSDPEPNNYFWNFGDGSFSNAVAPLHAYAQPGTYNVSLAVELNGRFGLATQSLFIDVADSADLGEDTTICFGVEAVLDPGISDPGASYVWNTGETTPTIRADTTQTYWVEVTLSNGCTSNDDIVVTEYGVTQQIGSQWYFGNQAALDFTGGAPQPLYDSQMETSEGCASISDINGELLFYTNGSTVWNKEHNVMMDGTLIGGDTTAVQSALIIPFADNATLFYIFTTEDVYGDGTYQLKYSVVDMKKDTARGAVVKKGVPLVNKSTERVTSSGFNSPNIVTHEFGNNNFRVYGISGEGINAAIHSSIGEPHRKENELNHKGQMKFSPLGSDVSVLIPGDSNLLEIFDFDFLTGAISNPRLIDLEEPAPAEAYGLEYSSNSQNIFVSFNDKVLHYELDSLYSPNAAADIQNSKNELNNGTGSTNFGSLQLGPDGSVYLAMDNVTDLGSITGASGETPILGPANLALDDGTGRSSRLGLPNFTQTGGTSSALSASATVACVGLETFFTGSGLDPNQQVETFNWDWGDGTLGSGDMSSPDTSHIYTFDTSTIATLRIIGCDLADTTQLDTLIEVPIQIFSIDEQPTVPGDTALCGGTVTLEAWHEDRNDLNYFWTSSTGDFYNTREVTFTEPQVVSVYIINDAGCQSNTYQVFIGDGSNYVELGEDLTLCQGEAWPTISANVANSEFVWRRDSTFIGNEITQEIYTDRSGIFTYSVEVTNIFTGCVARDSIQVSVLTEPEVFQSSVVLPSCNEANGSFSLEFTEGGSYSYELTSEDSVSYGPFTFDGPGTTQPFEGLSAGFYQLVATNEVSGCQNLEVMLLEDSAAFEMEAISENACFREGDIRVILRNFLGSRADITVYDTDGMVVYEELNRSASNIVIEDLDTGVYFVGARQLANPQCLQTDTVRLEAGLECYRTIVAPNAFSPNDNGFNDQFYVFPNEFVNEFEIFIYNRWGQLVFTSKDQNFTWDGSFQNQPAPPGTYAFKMVFTSSLEPDIGQLVQYGSVTLIR